MRFLFMVLALVLIGFSANSKEIHSKHCLYGCPYGSPQTNDLIITEIYILSSNDRTKLADWAAYKITADTIGPSRVRDWKPDPRLSDNETLEPDDYKNANNIIHTDRGHQVPLASFSGTAYWRETNYLSNITPQKSALNQGPWKKLEEAARKLITAGTVSAVYAMTGPLYEQSMEPLPKADESHLVPSGYWKILAIKEGDDIKYAAFILNQNTGRGADFCHYQEPISAIERRSGLRFFHELSFLEQQAVENNPQSLAGALGCN